MGCCKDCLYFYHNPRPVYFNKGEPEYICLEDVMNINPETESCEKFEEGFKNKLEGEQ